MICKTAVIPGRRSRSSSVEPFDKVPNATSDPKELLQRLLKIDQMISPRTPSLVRPAARKPLAYSRGDLDPGLIKGTPEIDSPIPGIAPPSVAAHTEADLEPPGSAGCPLNVAVDLGELEPVQVTQVWEAATAADGVLSLTSEVPTISVTP